MTFIPCMYVLGTKMLGSLVSENPVKKSLMFRNRSNFAQIFGNEITSEVF